MIVIEVLGFVEVIGTAAAQVVLAGEDCHRFGEHVEADWAAELLFQSAHGAEMTHRLTCLNVHLIFPVLHSCLRSLCVFSLWFTSVLQLQRLQPLYPWGTDTHSPMWLFVPLIQKK